MVMQVHDSIGNRTANATSHVRIDSKEGLAALLVAVERAAQSGLLTDVLLLAVLAAVLACCLCWRPRLTSAVVVAWLAWFVFRFAEGRSAWNEIAGHAQHARTATETAVGALAAMFSSWFVLAAPALLDLQRLLGPVFSSAGQGLLQVWNALSWKERGIASLSLLAVGSSVVAMRALCQHQDTVKQVFFQLSFAIVGPLIWWCTSHLPHVYAALLVGVVMSLVPSVASFLALLQLQWEREATEQKAKNDNTRSEWLTALDLPANEVIDEGLQAKMRMWLSYWALWPFLHVIYTLVNSLDAVNKDDRPVIDGLFVALIIWTQIWETSRIAPYGFALCAVCLRGFSERAGRVADVAGSRAVGHAAQAYVTLSERLGSSWQLYVAGALAVIAVASVLLQVAALTEALVSIIFLFCVAFDSARCVARSSVDVYTSRLAFWIIAMAWLKFREIPFLGTSMVAWTPLVFVVALAGGETVLNTAGYLVASLLSRLRGRSPVKSTPGHADPKYQEVMDQEHGEDGHSLTREPLAEAEHGDAL